MMRRVVASSLLAIVWAETLIVAPLHAAPPGPAPAASASPVVLAPPAPGSPLAPLGQTLTGQAKDDYDSGTILFENGDFAGALVKFQHAYELSSDVRLLWDTAACEKSLRHYVRVLRLVDRYLRDGAGRITEAQRSDAVEVLRTVRALVSSIRVVVNEPGASVFVDDELAGTSPLAEPVMVDLGDRRIRVTKPGFKEVSLPQRAVGASEVAVTVTLERDVHEGRLSIRASAAGTVQVDQVAVGTAPWEGAVSPGSHAVRVTASGMAPYSADVVVHDGELRTLDVTLQPRSGGISPVWWIAGSVLVAAGLGVGGYFLFHASPAATAQPTYGTISPGAVPLSF